MSARVWIAVAVFVLLAGWDLWEAIGNLVGLPPYYDALGISEATPWWLLVLGLAIPVAGMAIGVMVTVKGRSIGLVVVSLLVILATQAAMSLSVLSAEQAWRAHYVSEQLRTDLGLD